MNPRLLTVAEKAANYRGRNRRNAQRQARRRRERMIGELLAVAGPAACAAVDAVTGADSLDLLTAHLHRARSIVARIKRSVRIVRLSDPSNCAVPCAPIARPSRVLRAGNRGRVFPALLNAGPAHRPGTPVQDALAVLARVRWDMSPHAAVDLFVGSSGLPWAVAADLLHRRGLIPAAFSAPDINAIRDARAFWNLYRDGRAAFQAGVEAGEFAALAGDWAFFEAAQLATLLPGVRVPRALRRSCYLVNLVRDPVEVCLDMYSAPTCLPLIRHPL